jgi:hypothetical protein
VLLLARLKATASNTPPLAMAPRGAAPNAEAKTLALDGALAGEAPAFMAEVLAAGALAFKEGALAPGVVGAYPPGPTTG